MPQINVLPHDENSLAAVVCIDSPKKSDRISFFFQTKRNWILRRKTIKATVKATKSSSSTCSVYHVDIPKYLNADAWYRLLIKSPRKHWFSKKYYSEWFKLSTKIKSDDDMKIVETPKKPLVRKVLILGFIHHDGVGDAAFAQSMYDYMAEKLSHTTKIDIYLFDGHEKGVGENFVKSNFDVNPETKVTVVPRGEYSILKHKMESSEFQNVLSNYDLIIAGPYRVYWQYLRAMPKDVREKVFFKDELSMDDFVSPRRSIIFPKDRTSELKSGRFTNEKLQELFMDERKPFFGYMKAEVWRFFFAVRKLYASPEAHFVFVGSTHFYFLHLEMPDVYLTVIEEDGPNTGTVKNYGDPNSTIKWTIHVFKRLSQFDFRKAMLDSQAVVGVTGDQSFLEALQYGKVPIRDSTKSDIIRGFREYVRSEFGKKSKLYAATRYGRIEEDSHFLHGIVGPQDLEPMLLEVKSLTESLKKETDPKDNFLKEIQEKFNIVIDE